MTTTMLLATTAILLTSAPALAAPSDPQSSAQTSAPAAEVNQQGVLVFEPAFFTDFRPNTALDMVNRIPGFSVSDGDGSRGFEGAVGNILVNGARPASKNDTGSSATSRILAAQVERIELVRAARPASTCRASRSWPTSSPRASPAASPS